MANYVSLTDVKVYGDFVISETTDDDLLQDLIDRAEDIVEGLTSRQFAVSGITARQFDAVEDIDGLYLYFDEDCAEVTSVLNGDGETLTTEHYVVEPRNETPIYALKIKANSNKYWTYDTDPENAITVSGYWGYSKVPSEDIKHAVIRLVSWIYRQRESSVDLDRPLLTGDGTIVMPTRLPADILSIISKYKKLRIK